jgi:hypothetical protein
MSLRFNEHMLQMLKSRGMSESEAAKVMETVMADPEFMFGEIKGRWHDHFEDYPPAIDNMIWSNVRVYALKWLEENAPEAWFKPMFYGQEQINEFFKESGRPDLIL